MNEYVFYCKGGLHIFLRALTEQSAARRMYSVYHLPTAVLLEVDGRRARNTLTVLDLLG